MATPNNKMTNNFLLCVLKFRLLKDVIKNIELTFLDIDMAIHTTEVFKEHDYICVANQIKMLKEFYKESENVIDELLKVYHINRQEWEKIIKIYYKPIEDNLSKRYSYDLDICDTTIMAFNDVVEFQSQLIKFGSFKGIKFNTSFVEFDFSKNKQILTPVK